MHDLIFEETTFLSVVSNPGSAHPRHTLKEVLEVLFRRCSRGDNVVQVGLRMRNRSEDLLDDEFEDRRSAR